MNMTNKILSGVLGAGLAAPAYAQDYTSLQSVPGEYTIVMVPEGTKLWHVASEFTRGNDNLADGVKKTTLCDPYETKRMVSNANNDIAQTTAKVARAAGLVELAVAMELDSVMVKLKDGSTCEANPSYETVKAKDGLYGDGFAGLHSLSGQIPVAIPAKYMATVAAPVRLGVPSVDAPVLEVSKAPAAPVAPVVPAARKASAYGSVAGGWQYVHEFAEAPLAGHGAWLEGNFRVPLKDEKNALGLDLNHAWLMGLAYTDSNDNTVGLVDVDMTPVYVRTLSSKTRFTLGPNIDARSAAVTYAGVDAKTGQWALGPELGLEGSLGKFQYDTSASLGWGNVSTAVDINGYRPTEDALTKAKVNVVAVYPVASIVGLGAVGRVESDSQSATTQDGGLVPQNEGRYTLGGFVSLGKQERGCPQLVLGLEDVLLHTQAGDNTLADTDSVRGYAGVQYSW